MSIFSSRDSLCEEILNDDCFSGPKHIDEIREAGLDLPSVNQVEVRVHVLTSDVAFADY